MRSSTACLRLPRRGLSHTQNRRDLSAAYRASSRKSIAARMDFSLYTEVLLPTGLVDLAPCRAKTGWRRDLCLKIMVGLRASTHSATIKTNAPTNNTLDIFWQSNHDEIVHKNDHKNSRQRHTKSKGFFTGIVVIFFRCHAPGRMGKNPPAEQLSEAPSGSHSVIERRERHSLRAALPVLTRSRGETGQWRPIPSPPSRSDQHVV